jgi:D-alanyl-D-alanine carboxypeptidase
VTFVPTLRFPAPAAALAACLLTAAAPAQARTEATLLVDAETGKVLHAENATMPWYPASTSKLMTVYVTLQAVKAQRITLDSLFTVTSRAASQPPSKIGFKPGTKVTVDNALKILMVKSANDIAIVLAEGVSGSVENFSAEMNTVSKNLGMTQSNWVNPNGLPAEEQISSARDLAILARALLHDFPEYDMYWHIPAIQLGKKYMRNYNTLIGRYDGADGMKTGFICASGFNLVATASRNGKRLIAVVLGSPSSPYRAAKAAGLLERGFHRGPLSWLSPSLGTVDSLQPISATPPDLRDEMCGPHRKRPAAEDADDDGEASSFMLSNLPPSAGKASALLKEKPDTAQAIAVFIGAAKNAAEAQFVNARAKLQKLAKGKKADPKKTDPKTAPAAQAATAAQTATDAKATVAAKPSAPALQTATAPPPGAFTPTSNTPERATRKLPAATDPSNPALSYAAPASKTDPAPLTAMPDAKGAKPAAATAPAAKPKPKADAKPAAAAKQTPKPATPVKPAAAAKPAKQAAAPKQDASAKQ